MVGQGHYHVEYGGRIFQQSAEQVSHVTERERLAREAVRESQDPRQDTDHVIETRIAQQYPKRQNTTKCRTCARTARYLDA